MGKPFSATSMAGSSTWANDIVPHRSSITYHASITAGIDAESRPSLELIDRNRPAAAEIAQEPGAWKLALKDRQVLLLTASYFCSSYVFYFFFNWLYIYLVDSRGFQVLEGGYYAAAPWLTGAVGATLGGLVCDRLSERHGLRWGCRVPAIVGLVLAGGLIGAAATSPDPILAVVFLSLCLGSQQFAEGCLLGGNDWGRGAALRDRVRRFEHGRQRRWWNRRAHGPDHGGVARLGPSARDGVFVRLRRPRSLALHPRRPRHRTYRATERDVNSRSTRRFTSSTPSCSKLG